MKVAFLSSEIERQTNKYNAKLEEIKKLVVQLDELKGNQVDAGSLHSELERSQQLIDSKEKEVEQWKAQIEGQQKKID